MGSVSHGKSAARSQLFAIQRKFKINANFLGKRYQSNPELEDEDE